MSPENLGALSSELNGWRFLIDENLPLSLVHQLQASGYFAEHARDVGLGHQDDTVVFAYAQDHTETIITIDKGLSSILAYPPPHAGIISVRLPEQIPVAERIQMIMEQLAALKGRSFANTIVVIGRGQARVRNLP